MLSRLGYQNSHAKARLLDWFAKVNKELHLIQVLQTTIEPKAGLSPSRLCKKAQMKNLFEGVPWFVIETTCVALSGNSGEDWTSIAASEE